MSSSARHKEIAEDDEDQALSKNPRQRDAALLYEISHNKEVQGNEAPRPHQYLTSRHCKLISPASATHPKEWEPLFLITQKLKHG